MKRYLKTIMGMLLAASISLWTASCSTEGHGDHRDIHGDHAGHDREEGEIEITEMQLKTVGIELGHISLREMGRGINLSGVIDVSPQHTADISVMLPGVVKEIFVTEGSSVRAGQRVARIQNMGIAALRKDYIDATATLELARKEYDRQTALASQGAGVARNLERAETELRIAESARASLEAQLRMAGIDPDAPGGVTDGMAYVTSPITGTINSVETRVGAMADPSVPLMTVTDNSRIFATLNAYEKDLPDIKSGQRVEMTLTNGGVEIGGVVEGINPTIDPLTKTLKVRVRITESAGVTLVPGMALNATVSSGEASVEALPEEAVATMGGKSYIYVLEDTFKEDGMPTYHFRPVEVVTGNRSHGYIEVTPVETLRPDVTVVVAKAFYLTSMLSDHGEHNH